MNEKIKNYLRYTVYAIVFLLDMCILGGIFCGCITTNRSDSSRYILEHQAEITRLEAKLDSYERTTELAIKELGNIRDRAESIESTSGDVAELFDEYQRGVTRLLQYYRDLQGGLETKE